MAMKRGQHFARFMLCAAACLQAHPASKSPPTDREGPGRRRRIGREHGTAQRVRNERTVAEGPTRALPMQAKAGGRPVHTPDASAGAPDDTAPTVGNTNSRSPLQRCTPGMTTSARV